MVASLFATCSGVFCALPPVQNLRSMAYPLNNVTV
jgi:hypothetical protein